MLDAAIIKEYKFFSGLSPVALGEIIQRLDSIQVPTGTEIIRQNTPPDYFYFVSDGEVEITRRNRFGQNAKITSLKSGEGFGEMALLTCSHRQNTVTATSNVTLLRLSKKDFDEIIIMDSTFKHMLEGKSRDYQNYNNIKTLQPLALLEPEKMLGFTDRLIEKTYQAGETIITQGEKGDFYYIIKSGRVAILKQKGENPQPVEVDSMSSGEAFGEEALIRDMKRSATVVAREETTLLALDRKDFDLLLKKSFLDFTFPEDISEEEMQKFVFIDARIPAEYEEEHIAGAVNIPLEILRHKYQELDPEQEYIAYCTNDSRGMAAAFLLASQGFKAKNLRSGLSGWEGPVVTPSEGVHYPASRELV